MDLGVMHSGADGVVAPVMAQIQKDTTLMAILSLENNRQVVEALREATQVQGRQAFNTTMAQSKIYYQDYLQSRNSAIAQGVVFGYFYAQNMYSSAKELAPAEQEANTAGRWEQGLVENRSRRTAEFAHDKNALDDPRVPAREKEAASKRMDERLRRVEEMKNEVRSFTKQEDLERHFERDMDAIQVIDKDEDFEKILKNVRRKKKAADQRVSSATAKQDKNIQTANILSNIVQSSVTAATKYQQSQIAKVQAKAEMIKVLSEYTVQVFQQLMQLTLGVYNQQVDRVNQLIQAQATIAQLNRAA